MGKEKYRIETEDGSAYEIEVEDGQEEQPPAADSTPPLSRFFSSLADMVNIPAAIRGYMDKPNQWKAVSDVLGTQRGSPEEAAALERGMQVPLSNPMQHELPAGSEPAIGAAMQARQGDLAGAAGTLTGGYLVPPAVVKGISKASGLLRNRNPTKAAAIDYVTGEGVPVSAGAATGNLAVQGFDVLSAGSPGGSIIAMPARRATEEGMQSLGGRLMDRAHPQSVVAESAGAGMLGYLEQSAQASKDLADTNYQVVRDAGDNPKNSRSVPVKWERDPKTRKPHQVYEVQPMPVDIRELKAALKPTWEEMQKWWKQSQKSDSEGYQAVKTIMDEGWHVPAFVAEKGLGFLKALAREKTDVSAGVAKFIIPKLEKRVDDAVALAGPEAVTALQTGRQATAKQYATLEARKSIAGHLEEPVSAFEKMVSRKDTFIERLRTLEKEAPDELPKIGRAYIEELLEKAMQEGGFNRAKGLFSDWNRLGKETKKILFRDPLLIQNLDQFFLAAKEIADNPNPSGSAIVGAGAPLLYQASRGDVTGALTYTLGTTAVAALLHTPAGVKLLTKSMKIPLNHPAAASIMSQIDKLTENERIKEYLKSKGKQELPYTYANPASDPRLATRP